MKTPPGTLFTSGYVAVTLLEMLGDTLSIQWLHYACKPLIMGLLLLYAWPISQNLGHPAPLRWLLTGMVFALLGDVFLMIQEMDLFAPGLGMFLLMQLGYIRAFRPSLRPFRNRRFALLVLAFGVYLVVLRPAFERSASLQPLWWPVVVYAVCLCTMGLLAAHRQQLPGWRWVAVGALMFIVSDSLIAVNKFLVPIAGNTWLVMSTYATAQYLIVTGLIRPFIIAPRHSTNIT